MPEFLQIASALREQMSATLSRSDVLKPLAWMLLIMGGATVALGVYVPQISWLLHSVAGLFLAAGVIYLLAYVYCLFFNPDALRSEKYSLNKMAIEHGLYGDSNVGMMIEGKPRTATMIAAPEADGLETPTR